MSAALESSDLLPKVPRLPLSEVPEVSAYFKNTLRAMFGEDEDKVTKLDNPEVLEAMCKKYGIE